MSHEKFKVLVVDDDKEYVEAVKELLVRNNYDVITAYSGKEALERAAEDGRVGLVLLDLVMPLMDGFTLLEKLMEHDTRNDGHHGYGSGHRADSGRGYKAGREGFYHEALR